MNYFKPVPRYFFEIKRGLVQGGTLLIENYTTDIFLVNANPPVEVKDCFKPNELLEHVQGLRVIYYHEFTVGECSLVQCLAKKPIDKDALKYGFATNDDKKQSHTPAHVKKAEDLFKKK